MNPKYTLYVFTLDLRGGPLGDAVSDCGDVGSDLLLSGDEALAVLSVEVGLMLLVEDLVQALVAEEWLATPARPSEAGMQPG